MPDATESFYRYLPADNQSRHWGWRLIDAGQQSILPHAPYPPQGHPHPYRFDRLGRRVLDEFQVVFITAGSGRFRSRSFPAGTQVQSGSAFLLFPDEWHHYQPDPAIGWTEFWVGFTGTDAQRLLSAFFNPAAPIILPSHPNELIRTFEQLFHWLHHPVAGVEQILASHIPLILALLQSGPPTDTNAERSLQAIARQAKLRILQNPTQRTDLHFLATSLGVSYSKLRAAFKLHTGLSLRQYENLIKLNRARDLLATSSLNVSAIADSLGFNSLYYFSRAFKNHFGASPLQWRAARRRGTARQQ